MEILKMYQGFSDATRLRILNLLGEGPLCVCHLVQILEMPQPKVSRHLKVLREAADLETERCCNWTIYHLPKKKHPILEANLKCLHEARKREAVFKEDLKKRALIVAEIASDTCLDLPSQIKALAKTCD